MARGFGCVLRALLLVTQTVLLGMVCRLLLVTRALHCVLRTLLRMTQALLRAMHVLLSPLGRFSGDARRFLGRWCRGVCQVAGETSDLCQLLIGRTRAVGQGVRLLLQGVELLWRNAEAAGQLGDLMAQLCHVARGLRVLTATRGGSEAGGHLFADLLRHFASGLRQLLREPCHLLALRREVQTQRADLGPHLGDLPFVTVRVPLDAPRQSLDGLGNVRGFGARTAGDWGCGRDRRR
jgi:hypothetical protein